MAKKPSSKKKSKKSTAIAKRKQLNPAAEEKLKILKAMTPGLRAYAKKFADRVAKSYTAEILVAWDMGNDMKKILADQDAKYGDNAVGLLSRFLGLGSTPKRGEQILYEYMRIADTFSRDELKELCEKRGVDGKTISYKHIRLLSSVSSAKVRDKYISAVFSEGMPADALAAELRAREARGSTSAGSGRTPSPPRTPEAGFQQVYELSNQFQRRHELWGEAVFEPVLAAPPSDINANLYNRAVAARDAIIKLLESGTEDKNRLDKCLERMERIIKSQERHPASHDKSSKEKPTKKATTRKKSKSKSNKQTKASSRKKTKKTAKKAPKPKKKATKAATKSRSAKPTKKAAKKRKRKKATAV